MALSREQHNRIMRIYQDRRLLHMQERNSREEEIELHFPAFVRLQDELSQLRREQAESLLRKDRLHADALSGQIRALEAEKTKLLTENGYPADYLELSYSCPLCRDTGYVNYEKCGCHKKLISEEIYRREAGIPQELSANTFAAFDLGVFDDQAPIPKLRELTGHSVTQRAYMQTVEQICRNYAAEFQKKRGNLLLCGETGTGKTFLSGCIAQAVIDQCQQVLYVRAGDFFEALARESFERQTEGEFAQTAAALSCDLLIIDDLGTERRTDFTLSKLFSILNDRLLQKRATIISTNLDGNNITHIYGERVASRLAQFTVIPFYGKDLRLRGGR